MALKNESSLDGVDSRILKILEMDGRISLSELAANIGMSAPSVSERVRRLESRGIIKHFTISLDLPSMGYALQAIV